MVIALAEDENEKSHYERVQEINATGLLTGEEFLLSSIL